MKIGEKVSVGRAVGKITEIKDDLINVRGVYYYPSTDEEEDIIAEPWSEIINITKLRWNPKRGYWEYE